MVANFDTLHERQGTDCTKWAMYPEDVLPMWVADMDFRSPEPVIQALAKRVEHGIFGYPVNPAQMEGIREAIVDWVTVRHKWLIQPDDIVFMPGVVVGFNMACHIMKSPRRGVLVQTPVYPPMLQAAKNTGRLPQEYELQRMPDGTYAIDQEAFEASFTEKTGLFILSNPHNPVGRVFRQDELERMAEICLRRGVLICSDEIHGDLVFPGQRHIPIASLDPEIAQNTITLMAPSKTFNIPGLQLSFAIIPNSSLRRRFLRAGKGLVSWVNELGRLAAQVAYQEGGDWLDELLVYLEANRDYLYDYVNNELPGVRMAKPEGTYLAWLDCREAGIQGSPYEFFLENARVAFNDGVTFGVGGEGFVRLNFGCPRLTLVEALERMKTALNDR